MKTKRFSILIGSSGGSSMAIAHNAWMSRSVSVSSSDRRGVQVLTNVNVKAEIKVSVSSSDRRGVQVNTQKHDPTFPKVSVSSSDRRGVQAISEMDRQAEIAGFSILIGSSGGSRVFRVEGSRHRIKVSVSSSDRRGVQDNSAAHDRASPGVSVSSSDRRGVQE